MRLILLLSLFLIIGCDLTSALQLESDFMRGVEYLANYVFQSLNCSRWSKDEEVPMRFYFQTKQKRLERLRSPLEVDKLVHFDPRQPIKVLIHGYMTGSDMPAITELRKMFLKWYEGVNVVLVDWSIGSKRFMYEQVAHNTIHVSRQTHKLFKNLMDYWESKNVSRSDWGSIHIMGHSLGAHVAGQIGHLLKKHENFTVNRITGLDPAEPCFEQTGDKSPKRISPEDANFVDIVHTDSAVIRHSAFGIRKPLGHVDFYLNGGSDQPECRVSNPLTIFRSINYISLAHHIVRENAFCHHLRALDVFVESVKWSHDNKDCNYYGLPWNVSYSQMETMNVIQNISKCDSETCPQMGIMAENFTGYSNDERNTFYVTSANRPEHCTKYFADHREGQWSNTFPKRSFSRQLAIYFFDLTQLITDNIVLPIPHYVKNLAETIWKKIRNFTGWIG